MDIETRKMDDAHLYKLFVASFSSHVQRCLAVRIRPIKGFGITINIEAGHP